MKTNKEQAYLAVLDLDRAIAPLWFKSLESAGVSVNQSEVLFILGVEDASISHLSRELGVTSSAITQTVENLEKKQLVERKHKSSDRRVVSVLLSDKGEKCLRTLLQERYSLVNSLLDDFSEKELSQLVTLHKKMMDSIKD